MGRDFSSIFALCVLARQLLICERGANGSLIFCKSVEVLTRVNPVERPGAQSHRSTGRESYDSGIAGTDRPLNLRSSR